MSVRTVALVMAVMSPTRSTTILRSLRRSVAFRPPKGAGAPLLRSTILWLRTFRRTEMAPLWVAIMAPGIALDVLPVAVIPVTERGWRRGDGAPWSAIARPGPPAVTVIVIVA